MELRSAITAASKSGLAAKPTRTESKETKAEALSRANISKQKASQYELMAAHPDVVEQAKAEARETDGEGSGACAVKFVAKRCSQELRSGLWS